MVKRQVEQNQLLEQRAAEAKRHKVTKMMFEVEQTNQLNQILAKEKILREQEEDLKVHEYNREKYLRDQERNDDEKLKKDMKEREIQKMREMQEAAADR